MEDLYKNWTKEVYWDRDFLAWQDVLLENLIWPAWIRTDYRQNEFDIDSLCTAYACFGGWTSYTWIVIPKEVRKEFVDIVVADWLVVPWVWGSLEDVLNAFMEFINNRSWKNYIYLRMPIEDSKQYQDLWRSILTWMYGNSKFKKDKKDNCVIDERMEWDKERGHAINEYSWGWTNNSYPNSSCNLYFDKNYEDFIKSKYHFIFWYIITMTIDETTKEQIKEDKATLEFMEENKLCKLVDLDKPITRQDTFLVIWRAIKFLSNSK